PRHASRRRTGSLLHARLPGPRPRGQYRRMQHVGDGAPRQHPEVTGASNVLPRLAVRLAENTNMPTAELALLDTERAALLAAVESIPAADRERRPAAE